MAMDRLENLKNIIMYLMADNRVSHRIPSTLEERQRMMRALMNVWEPRPISEDFLKMQDAELQMQCEDKGVVEISDITPQTSDILLWQGDITRLKVDAIVNAANAQALGCWAPLHNCIDNCIHSAAGIQLRKECADKMQGRLLATGDAIITIMTRGRFCDHFCLDGCHLKIILIILKNVLTVDASEHHVVDACSALLPNLSGHIIYCNIA